MTYLQTEAPHTGSSDRLTRRVHHIGWTRRADIVANPLMRSLARYDPGDRHDGLDFMDAVTHVHEVAGRQRFPLRSAAGTVHLLVAGWGLRAHILRDGARQITDLIAPGDFCDTSAYEGGACASIEACGSARIAALDTIVLPEQLRAVIERGRHIQEGDVIRRLRARLVSLGRRDAFARLAHLMAETHARLADIGLTQKDGFDWPFTQEHLADILGLTPVHTNRVLGRLRDEGLLVVRNRHVTILDLTGLHSVGGFEPPHSTRGRRDDGLL